ncbi:unnamed protein product [Blepharisma stoltei]|uniref:Uncharacterized protein n=1 Tax=Blepharisma stoltei TaxID=1481888 RepID=A0AAU9JHM6_9CILI|nr:unnamed protein product [Blepharisma stoltei]
MNRDILYDLTENDLKQNEQRLLLAVEELNDLLFDLEQEKQELISTRDMLMETLKEIEPKPENIMNKVKNLAMGVWNNLVDGKSVHSQDREEWEKIMKEMG